MSRDRSRIHRGPWAQGTFQLVTWILEVYRYSRAPSEHKGPTLRIQRPLPSPRKGSKYLLIDVELHDPLLRPKYTQNLSVLRRSINISYMLN